MVQNLSRSHLNRLISQTVAPILSENELRRFMAQMAASTDFWCCINDGELLCIWGLIPPTLMSSDAYVWLHQVGSIKGHEFMFVRQSQVALEKLLERYPIIRGHCEISNEQGIRWIKWLGATFGDYSGNLVPFVIERKHD